MKEQVAHCHLIASVLAADGMMQEEEKEFLGRVMTRMELTDDEREQVFSFKGAESAAETMRAQPEEARQKVLDDLLEAALVDGQLSPHEVEMVKKVREALGL